MDAPVVNQFHVVMPGDLNDRNCLFGGQVLKWMDETAYVSASIFAKAEVVTVSAEKIRFLKPVFAGNLINLKAEVIKSNGLKIIIHTIALASADKALTWDTIAEAEFCFVAVDKNNAPKRIR